MFYNGNQYGKTGIALAISDKKRLYNIYNFAKLKKKINLNVFNRNKLEIFDFHLIYIIQIKIFTLTLNFTKTI